MTTAKDPELLGTNGLQAFRPLIKEDSLYSDREIVELLPKNNAKPHSRLRYVQKLFKDKKIKGEKFGRNWVTYGRAIKDFFYGR